jgi:hypothetical protein
VIRGLLVVVACAEVLFVVVYAVSRGVLDGDVAEALLAVPVGALQAAPFVLVLWVPRNAPIGAAATAAMLALTTVVFVDLLRDDASIAGNRIGVSIAGAWAIWGIALGVDLAVRRWGGRRGAHVSGRGPSLVDAGGHGQ